VVKVTDCGVAQALGEQACDQGDAVLGTAGYLPPEQAAGRPATPASDVHALGVVAYECLAGRRCSAARTRSRWRWRTCCGRRRCPTTLPPPCERWSRGRW
jgi:serine/threonine protein kinase